MVYPQHFQGAVGARQACFFVALRLILEEQEEDKGIKPLLDASSNLLPCTEAVLMPLAIIHAVPG